MARNDELVLHEFDGELLVYDLTTKDVASLDARLAALWTRCDGTATIDDLAAELSPGLERRAARRVVWIALEQLRAQGLLVEESLGRPGDNEFRGLTRRQMLKRAGLVGIGIPLMTTVAVPTGVAVAASGDFCPEPLQPGTSSFPIGAACGGNSDCCSGACTTNNDSSMTCSAGMFANPAAATCCPNFVCECGTRGGVSARPIGCACIGNSDCCSGACITNNDSSMTCAAGMFANPSAASCCT